MQESGGKGGGRKIAKWISGAGRRNKKKKITNRNDLSDELLHEEDEKNGHVGVEEQIEGDETGVLVSYVTKSRVDIGEKGI